MMTEIIQELTTIKIINEVTSEWALAWVRRVEIQRSQKALIEATNESKAFNYVKSKSKRISFDRTETGRRQMHNNCKYCWYSSEYAGARADRCQKITKAQSSS